MRGTNELGLGKLPPQAITEEEAILGALMLIKEALGEVQHLLFPSVFYRDAHQLIYSAILDLAKANNPVDIITVTGQLKKNETLDLIGGPFFITQLTNRVGGGGSLQHWTKTVMECWAKREMIQCAASILKEAYSDSFDIFNLIGSSDVMIQKINDSLISGEESDNYSDMVDKAVGNIINLSSNPNSLSGVPTGNHKLDNATGGWQRSDLIIMAARPGMGKTTRLLGFVKAALESGKSVAMFSLEMSSQQIIHKQINEASEIYINKLRTGNINSYELAKLKSSAEALKSRNFHLNQKGAVSPNYIRTACRRIKKKHGLDLVVIDYLQLCSPNERNRNSSKENEVSEVSAALKAIAKELDVPVIVLSQLNRDVESLPDKRPQLSHLRSSGSIEQDADIVLGMYRGSYYFDEMKQDVPFLVEKYEQMGYTEDDWLQASVIEFLKNRNGAIDNRVVERFNGALSRFSSDSNIEVKIQPDGQAAPF